MTLVLADQAPQLAKAHDELYPERVGERIPLSLTLLYPFAPASEVDAHLEKLRGFFAARPPLRFALTRVAQWENGDSYAVPEPDDSLRETMRALWQAFPEFPPYGVADSDPPPHASLTRGVPELPAPGRAEVEERLDGLLPAPFVVRAATLLEEEEPDLWRVRDSLPFGAADGA